MAADDWYIPYEWKIRPEDPGAERCPGCGGYLSFEYHDEAHAIWEWNTMMAADRAAARLAEFDKRRREQEAIEARAAKRAGRDKQSGERLNLSP